MKIAIASCAKLIQAPSQPAWQEIQAEQPDVLMLLGDTVYLQHDNHLDPAKLREELAQLYKKQFAEPHFSALLSDMYQRGARVLAMYDDHDFLGNNRYGGDHDPALGEAARAAFKEAFAINNDGADVYQVVRTGKVDIFMLDERFYRTSPAVSAGNRDAILGARQWEWFEASLAHSDADYIVVGSSSTFHSFGDESWEQYPAAFGRMRDLLRGRKGALIASGDVHRNALYDDSGVLEVVTSAIARNSLLFGAPRRNYGILTYDGHEVHIELRSLKAGWRFNVRLARDSWTLDTAHDAAHSGAGAGLM